MTTGRRLRLVDLATADAEVVRRIVRRRAVPDPEVRRQAEAIVREVADGGDDALRSLGERLGGGRPDPRVPRQERVAALDGLDPDLRDALERAIAAATRFHEAQRPEDLVVEVAPGVTVARRWTPARRIGAYVPGGRAAYPSTIVMTTVPARVAGVGEVVVATPAGPDGALDPTVLAAAELLEVDELYAMGGAQAIAALAFGTETIRPVDKIVGPGNAWVTAAKLAVHGICGIDLPAGPSEVLVIADATADPELVAIDLLCQAEHGPDSPAVLVATDRSLVDAVEGAIDRLLDELPRAAILDKALADHGLAVLVPDIDAAVAFANAYAAEHVSVETEDPEVVADRVVAAGSVYVGRWSPESAGDYATGANHVLPTGGLARAEGPLAVEDMGSWRQVQTLTADGLAHLTPTIARLARAEGLDAHRLAAELRIRRGDDV